MKMIPKSLLNEYLKTSYDVDSLGLKIKIYQKNEELNRFLKEFNYDSWCFITAWNPYSKSLSKRENIIFNNNLKIDLMQYKIYPSIGRPRNTEWEAEESFFVLNINEQEAINLGIKFKQNAIVYGYVDCEPKLLKLI